MRKITKLQTVNPGRYITVKHLRMGLCTTICGAYNKIRRSRVLILVTSHDSPLSGVAGSGQHLTTHHRDGRLTLLTRPGGPPPAPQAADRDRPRAPERCGRAAPLAGPSRTPARPQSAHGSRV